MIFLRKRKKISKLLLNQGKNRKKTKRKVKKKVSGFYFNSFRHQIIWKREKQEVHFPRDLSVARCPSWKTRAHRAAHVHGCQLVEVVLPIGLRDRLIEFRRSRLILVAFYWSGPSAALIEWGTPNYSRVKRSMCPDSIVRRIRPLWWASRFYSSNKKIMKPLSGGGFVLFPFRLRFCWNWHYLMVTLSKW